MGTRSLTHVKGDVWKEGEKPKTLVTIYRQMDGYPEGMGADLAKFLKGRSIVNGLQYGDTRKVSNGMGELAAQLVQYLKQDNTEGNIYIYPPDSEDVGEEYTYIISNSSTRSGESLRWNSGINFTIINYNGKTLFDGPISAFNLDEL